MTPTRRQQREQKQQQTAVERGVGRTAEQRLLWAVETFLRAPLETELPEVLATYGVYLTAFNPVPSAPGEVVMFSGPAEGFSPEQVKRIQRQFDRGLTGIRRHREWPNVPAPTHRALVARAPGEVVWFRKYDYPEAAVLAGLAEHVAAGWAQLRDCPECKRLFVRNRKQEYCSTTCSMKRRNRKRKKPRKRSTAKRGV